LTDARGTAGIGRYVRSLADALSLRGDIQLELATPRRPAGSERYPLRYLHSQPSMAAARARLRPDLLHATASEPALGWPLSRQVVTVHDVLAWSAPAHRSGRLAGVYWGIQRRRLRRCAAIVVPGRSAARAALTVLGLRADRVSVVPEGVAPVFTCAPSQNDDDRRRRQGIAGEPYALWTGSLVAHDPRKALDLLLDAVAVVRRDWPELRLVLVGRRADEATRVEDAARARGVPVVMPGYVPDDDLTALLRGAAVVVVPSLDEGFGLPALEALACGAPLVTTRVGDLPEICGDAALLVPPGDAAALAGALGAAVSGGPVTTRLRGAGPARAAAYTWERTAEETVAVYRRVSRRNPP
jgi:glycosyltransferase involved in cell wall biosynthesis